MCSSDLQQVTFVDALRGARMDLGGHPWWTIDGGATWQAATGAGDVLCFKPRRGPAGSLWCAGGGSAQLLRSLDAGRTWSVIELPVADPEQPVRTVDVAWADDRTGYVVASRDVYVTRDGGATWQQQPAPVSGLRTVGTNTPRTSRCRPSLAHVASGSGPTHARRFLVSS